VRLIKPLQPLIAFNVNLNKLEEKYFNASFVLRRSVRCIHRFCVLRTQKKRLQRVALQPLGENGEM
jgi:hypothetical protein